MSIILRCPKCEKHYESPDDSLKKSELQCPECGLKSHSGDFCAMMFCPHCRGKLAVSLSVLHERRLVCPRCDKAFTPNVSIDLNDDEINTNSLFEEDKVDEGSTFKQGDFFDKYEIVRLLGRGGMGEVYLAKHLFLHKEVALKIMLSSMAAQNPVFAKRFVREAKIANRISSPNLIPVFDVGIDSKNETLFLAMEYVNGINVSDMIKTRGVFDENTALHIAYRVASALKAMENANVIHRDIKPSNIMIDISGEIKLADLGIAKSVNYDEGDLTLTQDNMVFGTPNFASPEQCRSSHNVDCRSDIYSLGATMFHMVTGYPPFRGKTPMETMLQVLNEPAPNVSSLNKDISPEFAVLISDMLQKDPAKRPQNADELQQRISEIFNGECGLRSKLFYLSKSASKKLRPISGMINDVPSRIYNSIPWGFFRRLTGIAVILLILFAIFFFGARRRDYFRVKYAEIMNKLKSPESAEKKPKDNTILKPEYKTPKKKFTFDRSQLYKKSRETTSRPKVSTTAAGKNSTKKAVAKNTVTKPSAPQAEKISNPETKKAAVLQPAKQTADISADPFKKHFPDTLDGRIARCSYILEALQQQNAKDSAVISQQISFFKELQRTLSRQKHSREAAANQKLSSAYSDNAVNAVMRIYRHIKANVEPETFTENVRKLVSMMKNPSVDPNLELETNQSDNSKQHILKIAVTDDIFTPELRSELISILIKRNVLTDCLAQAAISEKMLNPELIRYGIDPLDKLLLYAVKKRMKDIALLLISCGADVNQSDNDGNTVLHCAMLLNDSKLVRMLLHAGADVNRVNKSELQTPLFWAEKFSDADTVSMLIKAGASVNYKDIYGKQASDYSSGREFNHAVRTGNITKTADILTRYPDLTNSVLAVGLTPLQYAVRETNLQLTETLLQVNADTAKCTAACPEMPLQTAFKPFYEPKGGFFNLKKEDETAIFNALISAGADFNIPYAVGKQTPMLHYAIQNYAALDSRKMKYLTAMLKKINLNRHAAKLVNVLYAPLEDYGSGDTVRDAKQRMNVLKMLILPKTNLNSGEGSSIIPIAGSSLVIPETELDFLLEHKADVNGKDAQGRSVIYRICEKAADSGKPALHAAYADRIIKFIDLGAKVDCSADGKTIADMELPNIIANITEIKSFRRRHGR